MFLFLIEIEKKYLNEVSDFFVQVFLLAAFFISKKPQTQKYLSLRLFLLDI